MTRVYPTDDYAKERYVKEHENIIKAPSLTDISRVRNWWEKVWNVVRKNMILRILLILLVIALLVLIVCTVSGLTSLKTMEYVQVCVTVCGMTLLFVLSSYKAVTNL